VSSSSSFNEKSLQISHAETPGYGGHSVSTRGSGLIIIINHTSSLLRRTIIIR
jgi:hypothetical protein